MALAWPLRNPAVTAPIIGARTLAQLEDNLAALGVDLPGDALSRLQEASAIKLGFPHDSLDLPLTRGVISGGTKLSPRG